MKLTKGIKFEEDPQYKKVQDEKIDLKVADRHRSETEKGMDDLLFGSGAVRKPRAPPAEKPAEKVETKPQPPKVQPPKPQVPKPISQPEKPVIKVEPKPELPKNEPTKPTQSKPVEKKLQPVVEQQQRPKFGTKMFNRPAYIRKLKKIAQNFDFDIINQRNHSFCDVVRPFECQKTRVQNLQNLNSQAGHYEDKQFPATYLSVGRNYKKQGVAWSRASQFCNRASFGKYVQPNDIQLGKLSCPSFVSVLSCLAERQRNIKRIIQNQQYNPNGFYFVRLNINGVWRYIAVDDFLPTLNQQNIGLLSFNDSQSQISLSLIQKAYAKVYNGYDVFEKKCKPQNYLRDLTGSRVAKYTVNDSQIHEHVQFALQQGWTVVAVPNNKIEELGLDSRYNLSVIGLGTRGFQVRNSWGTTVEKPKVNLSREGVFEVSMQEASKYFEYLLIAETDDKFHTSTIQSKHHSGFYSSYSFKLKQAGQTIISASQWDLRLFPSQSKYSYAPMRIILQRKREDRTSEYVAGTFSHASRNTNLLLQLTPGEYSVFCIGSWPKGRAFDYSITVFCNHLVKFTRNQTQSFPNLITKSLQQLNLNEGKRSAKGHVDEYILYHQPTNLMILTNLNVSDKPYDYTQDLSKINYGSLNLLNGPNTDDHFSFKLEKEVKQVKNDHNNDRRWNIHVEPKQAYTWVLSTDEDYNVNNFKTWGFK